MAFIKSLIQRIKAASLVLQILAVLLAFGIMAVISNRFVVETELNRMDQHVYSDLERLQVRIESDMGRIAAVVGGVSQTLQGMVLRGDSLSELVEYIDLIANYAAKAQTPGFLRFIAYSDLFDIKIVSGGYPWPDSLDVTTRPWYTAAVAANGNIVFTDPYISPFTDDGGQTIITCARHIADADGKTLAIVGMHVTLEPLTRHVNGICRLYGPLGAYGIMFDSKANVIMHPDASFINTKDGLSLEATEQMYEMKGHATKDSLRRREFRNYNDVKVYGSFKKINLQDWNIGLVMPKDIYMMHARSTVWYFLGLNALVLGALCYVLIRLSKAKRKSDEFTRIVFDTVPLASDLWNNDREIVACNDRAVQLFGARSKQDFIDRFYDFSPEYQPCGKPSKSFALEMVNKAFDEGICRFEWMHKTNDGKPLPCEITLVRVKYGSEPAVISYDRDLREEKAAMEQLREAEEHIQAIYNAAPLCINTWDASGSLIDCNTETLKVFEVKDKKELIDNFVKLAPAHQPDGSVSVEKLTKTLAKTFKEGHYRTVWEHRSSSGESLPFDITFVRLKHKEGYIAVAYALDLREINAAMAKMREADERQQILLDAIPVGANFWDKELNIVDCNLEVLRLFELPGKREYIERFQELSPEFQPDGSRSCEKCAGYLKKAFEEGYARFDWTHRKLNGEEIPCDITLVRVKYKDDYMVAGYTQDKREINAMIAQLRESDERAMMMLDTAPTGVTMWDRNINLIDFNMEAARVIGVNSKAEYREKFGVVGPEIQPDGKPTSEKLVAFLSEIIENGRGRTLWHHNHVNGETIPFDAQGFRIKYKNDDVAIVYCTDLRELNAANAKMREADEIREILFNASPVSCTLFEKNFTPIECNNEALNLLGITDKREYMNNFKNYTPEYQPSGAHSETQASAYARKAMEDGMSRFEWTHKHASGELIPCEITLVRVKHRDTNIMAGYVRDLRQFKAMVREAHRAEIAEEGNRAKSRFLAAMSHEIRTPMNVILGVTDIHLQDDSLPPHLREAFTQIYNSSDLLLGIINDILDLSKIEAGKMEFTPSKYVLASLINDTAHLNMMRNSKPIEFELNISEDAPAHLYGDELRIKQILNNLLSNAFKFTDEGMVKLNVYAEANGGADDVTLVISVNDTGQGMSDDQIKKLFTEYTRFNLETNRTIEGTGLGMNITRRLVGMMNGQITVESKKEVGTTVMVRLPQKRIGSERIGKELAENLRHFRVDTSANLRRTQITRDYMPYGKVLIVDDVESNLYVARGLMASYGLSIDTATSGYEAIDKIKNGCVYDIVFMDHMMPKMDGIEATKLMRETGYSLPIVALTANAVVGQADIFLSNGFDDFISKPIDIRQLNAILNRFIRDKQPPEVLEKAKKLKDRALKHQPLLARPAVEPELLGVFARDAVKVLPIIESVAEDPARASDEAMQLFTINVHAMKSALANIGEMRLSQVAYTLEKAGKLLDRNKIALQSPSFIKALRGIISAAEAESKLKPPAEEDADPKLLKDQMALIATACRDYDERKASEALEILKQKSWTAKVEDTLVKIAELLLHSSFEEAAELAERSAAV